MTPQRAAPSLGETQPELVDHGPDRDVAHVYVHVPFCRDRCTYCAFPTVPDRPTDHALMVASLLAEEALAERVAPVGSLYLGGGTPALLDARLIATLVSNIGRSNGADSRSEITLECNPNNITHSALESWAESGVNRLSVGIQTFDSGRLKAFARHHDGSQAHLALDLVLAHWTSTWSADLLVGWSGQTTKQLEADLAALMTHYPPHVSVYGLTVEPRTPLARLRDRGTSVTVGDDDALEFDRIWCDALEAHGLERYEVSNFARPGHRSHHNEAYWFGHDYLGLGPGAGSSRGTLRWSNRHDTRDWLDALEHGRSPRERVERLGPEDRLLELLGSGLRTRDGLDKAELDRRFSPAWRAFVLPAAQPLIDQGVLRNTETRLTLSHGQLVRVDRVLAELVRRWPLTPDGLDRVR